ncbi:uncharacterized protein A1O5_12683 [Cladophialophora psammophila CBS 110553]|uniref:Ferritin/DPS protein domain-containing protein n=1 Tax=Cladophialophora psammophila CBS 110553 TaxID=1182543 RepID=W9VKL5_9EURO|nr:uncharacterized protein A1O5_12683 [Cladophialophora psammophila CBS 110553]EXJ56227.1 hypothetical protein A1O5_12683 [Cladophialophora psammophila CBS 110553]
MYFPLSIYSFLYVSCLALRSVAAGVMLSPETADVAGGGAPSGGIATMIATNTIRELQLAFFLENLEHAFFNMSLTNLGKLGITGYPNDTIQVVEKIVAQEEVHLAILTNLLDDI